MALFRVGLAMLGVCLTACSILQVVATPSPQVTQTGLREPLPAYSFVVLGCNRVDADDVTSANPSTANLEQLNRTFAEVAQMSPKPAYLFFMGDMVTGLDADATVLQRQLQAWVEVYKKSPLGDAGIRLVALPGNHEFLKKDFFQGETPNRAAEAVWLKVMAPFIPGSNGPKAGGADHLATDQSRLSYSFQFQDSHFVCLNTDTADRPSTVPVTWVSQDVAAAHKDPTVKHIFVLGHKPAYAAPTETDESGLGDNAAERDTLWRALGQNGCEAMLAAHNHLYYRIRPAGFPTWQVIAGNGGSPLATKIAAKDRFFGYTVVNVLKDGRVTAVSMGRDEPKAGYLAPAAAYPTTVRDSFDLTDSPHT